MSRHSALFTCLVSWMLTGTAARQVEPFGAGNPFHFWDDPPREESTTRSGSNSADSEVDHSTYRPRHGSGDFGGRTGINDVSGFGSVCSLESQCNLLLGLACISHGDRWSRCDCAPSTPVYVNEGGIEKCVRPKDFHEACVSDQECSYNNPNVRCVNFLCNCSPPFEMTLEKLCELPSGPAASIVPTAVSVMLALALLVVVGGYVYQRMQRERSSSLSTKAGRSVHADIQSTSSTTRILVPGRPWGGKEECEQCEVYGESWRLRAQSELSLPLHPPRYISHRAASSEVAQEAGLSTVQECCSAAESISTPASHCASSGSSEERLGTNTDTPLPRTLKKQDLVGRDKCTNIPRPECKDPSSSSPIHMFLPENEQIRRILNKDQQIVITVQAQRGRHNLRTEPNLPPVVSIRRREPPPSESTDDSFMKDLKRRRQRLLMGRLSEELSTAAATTSGRRSASASVAVAAAHSSALLRSTAVRPGRAHQVTQPSGKASGTAIAVHGCSSANQPAKLRSATVEPVKNHREMPEPATKTTAGDQTSGVAQKTEAPAQATVPPTICDERSGKDGDQDSPAERPRDSTKRTSSVSIVCEADTPTMGSHSVSEAQVRYGQQREQNCKESDVKHGTVSLECGKDMSRACPQNARESHGRIVTEAKNDISLTGVVEFHEASPQADSTPEICMPASLKQRHLKISEEILKDIMANKHPKAVRVPEDPCPVVNPLQRISCPRFNTITPDHIQVERIRIEEFGEIAGLLSKLIGKEAENENDPTLENPKTDSQVSPTLERTCNGSNTQARPAPVNSARPQLDPAGKPIAAVDFKPGLRPREIRAGTTFQTSLTELLPEQVTQDHPSGETSASNTNAADRRAESKPALPNVRHKSCRSITVREAVWPSWVEIIDNTYSEIPSPQNFVALDQPSPACGFNRKISDDAKCSNRRTSMKLPEPITLYSPQDISGLVRLGTSRAPETNFERTLATRELLATEKDQSTASSPTFSVADRLRNFLLKQVSSSSVASETTLSLYRDFMAKKMEPPLPFTERPFADVLASLESEMTSITKDEPKADTKYEKATSLAATTPADTEAIQSSSQHDGNYEDLNEAIIKLFSFDDAESDSRPDVESDEAVETCTSASSVKTPNIECLTSVHATPARALGSDEASKVAPRTRKLQPDSVDVPVQLQYTKLKTVLSSTSVSHAATNDRAEPDTSEQTTTAPADGTRHSTAITKPPQTHSLPTVQGENFQQPASYKIDLGIQAQPSTPYLCTPHLSQPKNDHQHDSEHGVTPDRQWIEDVEKVPILGNECNLKQHLPKQMASESAPKLEQTQCALPPTEGHKQPAMSTKPRTATSESFTLLGSDLTTGCNKSTLEEVALCYDKAPSEERCEPEDASCESPVMRDFIAAQCPVVSSKDLITVHLSKTSSLPPLRTLCSQVLASDDKCEEEELHRGGLAQSQDTVSSCASFEHAAVTAAIPSETACRQKGSNPRLPSDALSTPVADDEPSTSFGVAEVQIRRRARSQSVGSAGMSLSRPDQGLSLSTKAKATAPGPAQRPIRFLGPLSSQNFVVLPDSSVAICLPEGASRDDLWAPKSSSSLRQSNAAGGSVLRHRHLMLASALEDPSFESIYNAILLPNLAAQEVSAVPGDVPCRPTRSTSSSRAVSFDNSPTVVPLEPPPQPFAQCDASKTTDDTQPALPPTVCRPRRRSSLCRSSSGSLPQEMLEAADLCSPSGGQKADPFCRLHPILLEPDGACDAAALAGGAGSQAQSGGTPLIPEELSPLISPFYSFEDTTSEH